MNNLESSSLSFNQKAFTLIEILMVLIVIGTLVTLSTVKYTQSTQMTRVGEASTFLNVLKKEVILFRSSRGSNIIGAAARVCGNNALENLGIAVDIPNNSFFEYCITRTSGGGGAVPGNANNLRIIARNPAGLGEGNRNSLSVQINEQGDGVYKMRGQTTYKPLQ